ncbi:hypothetical protein [Bordetella petrii]|uniref:Membrane protein n=1 Tax=Bordetella petrii (strain ATCC BAA-461 / DSM 12804 / CCUG 43448 / CIP 107267 / Se-1111R) TaxID=340100 RepID=A9I8X1_BORPD|nr:hypothetical protein [Bordetella petrii]CAP41300.1 putative membrane protein [Bordetella petrii]
MNRAIREWFDWRGWTVAGAAIAIVLGLIAIRSPGFRAFIAHPATAGWAAAFATAFTAAVALYLAGQQTRTHRREAVEQAALYAAYLAVKLDRYTAALDIAATGTLFDDEVDHTPKFGRFREELEQALPIISVEHAAHLVPIGERTAHQLARALSEVEEVRRDTDALSHRQNLAPGHKVPNRTTERLGLRLSSAVDLLKKVNLDLNAIALDYAPAPDPSEIFGDD